VSGCRWLVAVVLLLLMVLRRVELEVGGAGAATSTPPSNKLGGGLDLMVLDGFPRLFSHPGDGGIGEGCSRPCRSKLSGYARGFGDHDWGRLSTCFAHRGNKEDGDVLDLIN
jgi:hypothetical protein